MEKISVVIPVFRESDMLERALSKLSRDRYPAKEIVVAIDEPTGRSLQTARKFRGKVKFLLSSKRRGKAAALNNAAEKADGDIILFFDSDNILKGGSNRNLEKIVRGMQGKDIAEIKTDTIKNSVISRLAGFDFVIANFASNMYSNFSGRKPVIGGVVVVMRKAAFDELGGFRNEITEDVDIGWRAFEKGMSYTLIKDVCVLTKTPSTLKGWFVQRRRWSVGTSKWVIKDYRSKIRGLFKDTGMATIPSTLLIAPTIILAIISMLISDSMFEDFLILSIAILPIKIVTLTSLAFFIVSSLVLLKSLAMYMTGFGISFALTLIASKKLGYSFRPLDYIVYYFLYSPMMIGMYFYGFLLALSKNIRLSDWKA